MMKLAALLRRDQCKIAENITEEQGKTLIDAEGDVLRGIQVNINSIVYEFVMNEFFTYNQQE